MKPRRLSLISPLLLAISLFAMSWLMLSTSVGADAIITVDSTFDDTLVNLNGNGTCDLREAIEAANTDTAVDECSAGNGADTILFDGSLTAETDAYIIMTADDGGLDAGEYGPSALVIASTMVIQGPGTENGVVLWGSFGTDERRLFHVMPGGNLTLENVTLTKGVARGGNGGGGNAGGGGAAGMGGAIFNEGTLNIIRTTFVENAAYGGHGHPNQSDYGSGGGGGTGQDGQDEQNDPGGAGGDPNGGTGGVPDGNGGDGGDGGGGGGGGGSWCACTHTAGDGGNGGFGGAGGGGGHALATGGGTQATGGDGGDGGFGGGAGGAGSAESGSGSGAWAGVPGTGGFGGGDGQAAGTGSASVGGAGGGGAGMGGAIFNHGGTVTVESSTFSGNVAWGGSSYETDGGSQFDDGGPGDGYGGAIFSRNGSVTIANSTLVSNTVVAGEGNVSGAAAGGGIYFLGDGASASLNLDNTIMANSSGANTQISDYTLVVGPLSGTTDVVGNAINAGTNPSGGASNQIESQSGFSGGVVSTADPDVGPLQDNTGPAYTHAPNVGSVVIDAGSCGSVATDQRGVARPLDGEPNGSVVCDIGAVEFNPNLDPVEPPGGDPNLVGNRLRLSDMGPDGNNSYGANRPAVAYNSMNDEYLVVWYGDDDSGSLVDNEFEIFGQRVDGSSGAEIGSDFRISQMGPDGDSNYDAFYPRVAYNATSNEYLVVWHGDHNGGTLVDGEVEVFGQRLNGATGAEIGSDFRISNMGPDGNTSYAGQYPDVVWNATDNQYLVVWHGDDDSGSLIDNEFEIFGQLIDGATGAEIGGDFRISDMGPDGDGNYDAQYVRVAWNSANNEYLVVWQADDNSAPLVDNEREVFGQRLNGATGAEIGTNDFRISDMGPDGDTNYTAAGFASPPTVVHNPVDNEYLVVWHGEDDTGSLVDGEYEIFGQRLDGSTGAEVGTNDFRISDVGIDGNTRYNAYDSNVAYSGIVHEYLVIWDADEFRPPLVTDNEREVYGQRLDASSGAEVGANDFRISEMGPDNDTTYGAFYPHLAANSSSAEYLIVWQGDDDAAPLVDNENEIFGQRYGIPFPGLTASKTAGDTNPTSGDVLTFTVVISNNGSADATGAVVSDGIPAGLAFVGGSTTLQPAHVGTAGDAPTLVSGLTISVGEAVTVTYQTTVTVLSGGITNSVSVTSTETSSAVTDTAQITVAAPQYALNVTLMGDSTGSVASDPAGISCGADCSESYSHGTVVTLTASYDSATTALVWGGDCAAVVDDSCTLTMDRERSVSAHFFDNTKPVLSVAKTASSGHPTSGQVLTYTVTIRNQGLADATGAVVSDGIPAGLAFVGGSTTLQPAHVGTAGDAPTLVSGLTISAGEAVTVTYQTTVTVLSGGITNSVSVTSTETSSAVTDTAQITVAAPQYALNVTLMGDSTGSVTSDPAGISCGADCSESYSHGTVVTLTASYDSAATALVWGGDCAAVVDDSCTLTMDRERSVSAHFYDKTKPVLIVEKAVSEDTPMFGEVITYTVVVRNAGTVDATDGVVLDAMPAGLAFVGGSTTLQPAHVGTAGDAPTLVSGLAIAGGQAITVTYRAEVTAISGGITNTVSVTSSEIVTPLTDTARINVRGYGLFLPLVIK
jgi:uncharacterized repeat protein (TIGR01451 family)